MIVLFLIIAIVNLLITLSGYLIAFKLKEYAEIHSESLSAIHATTGQIKVMMYVKKPEPKPKSRLKTALQK